MSSLVDQIRALRIPPDIRHGNDKELHHHMTKNILGSLNAVASNKLVSDNGQDPLTTLDPFQDSLGYLYILMAQISMYASRTKSIPPQMMPGQEIWQKIVRFVSGFDPLQMRYSGKQWFPFVNTLSSLAPLGKSGGMTATHLLAQAMLRLDPSCGTLTTNHLDLVRMAVESTAYDGALPVLDRDVHSLPQKSGPPDTFPCSDHGLSSSFITIDASLTEKLERNEVLEYYLLCAMVYIGVQDFGRAKFYLEHVLSTPTSQPGTVTGMMLEAYKKWVLVSLLVRGKTSGLPNTTNQNAVKTLRSLAKPYESIAEAFKNHDRRRLQAEVDEAQKMLTDVGNTTWHAVFFSNTVRRIAT